MYVYKGDKPGWGDETSPETQAPATPRKKAARAACGTNSGYYRHYQRREPACGPCKAAHAAANRARSAKARPELKPCGTHAAYARHVRAGEIADEACLEAHRQYMRRYKAAA